MLAAAVAVHVAPPCLTCPTVCRADPTVLQRMRDWEVWLVKTFKPDGLRYDAATNSLPVRAQRWCS